MADEWNFKDVRFSSAIASARRHLKFSSNVETEKERTLHTFQSLVMKAILSVLILWRSMMYEPCTNATLCTIRTDALAFLFAFVCFSIAF